MSWTERVGRRLNPRDLHVFMAVVEQGTMAKAAQQLAISRPVISKTIAALERTLGVPLLDRSARGVEPTLYGRALLSRSVAVFDELKQGVRDIEFLADPTQGELKIACPSGLGSTLLLALAQRFLERYPNVTLHTDVVTYPHMFQELRQRECDLFLTMLPLPEHRVPDGLHVEVLFDDQLVVAAGPDHRLAQRRKVDLAELVDERFVLSRRDSWNYLGFVEAFRARGLTPPKISSWSNFTPLRRHLVTHSQFLTTEARSNLSGSLLKVLPVDLPNRPWPVAIVTLQNRTLSPIVKLFTDFARDFTKPMRKSNQKS
jgi:DNA-binding transcriptional LysR family regulator